MSHFRQLLLCVLAGLVALSCAENLPDGQYCRLEDGHYVFDVAMDDSAAVYDISFYTRLDGLHRTDRAFPMFVDWFSPSGEQCSETVYFPVDEESVTFSSALTTCLRHSYRTGLNPLERGIWRLEVKAYGIKGMEGLGIICEKRQDGTR